MKAAVVEELRKPLVVRDMPDPKCAPDGAVVRTGAEGVCRSDWHMWMGDWAWVGLTIPTPFIMGHEFCGTVEEAGKEVKNFKRGDRVVIPFSQGDGTCDYCRDGFSNICANGTTPGVTYGGGYGAYVGVPRADQNMVRLADKIDFVEAASMGCRFMTSFHGVVDQAQVRPGEWVVVYGCGGIGLSAVQISSAMGANVIAVDLDGRKLELAKSVGAMHIVNGKTGDPTAEVVDITKGGAHVSVDALGIAATCRNSINSLRKRGRHVQIGLTSAAEKGEVGLPIDKMVMMEIEFKGSLGMQASHYPAMLRMVEAGRLSPKKMVTQTIKLEEASGVIAQMSNFENLGVSVIDRF